MQASYEMASKPNTKYREEKRKDTPHCMSGPRTTISCANDNEKDNIATPIFSQDILLKPQVYNTLTTLIPDPFLFYFSIHFHTGDGNIIRREKREANKCKENANNKRNRKQVRL